MASAKKGKNLLTALVANREGEIFELDGYAAVGMSNSLLTPLPPLFQPAGTALRSDQEVQLPVPLRMEKILNSIVVEIGISAAEEEAWKVQVLLKKKGGQKPQEGLRVTLKDMAKYRELQSLLARKGIASFQDISNGEYIIEIKNNGIVLGKLSFCLSKA